MPDAATLTDKVDRYLAAITARDVDAVVALYAPDATVEDPFGTDAHVGLDAIRAFYARSLATPMRAERTGAVRCAVSAAAFPFKVTVPGARMSLDIIDVFTFDAQARITSMRAYWGPTNVTRLTVPGNAS